MTIMRALLPQWECQLHWLLVKQRIHFKITTLTYRTLQSGSPSYLSSISTILQDFSALLHTIYYMFLSPPRPMVVKPSVLQLQQCLRLENAWICALYKFCNNNNNNNNNSKKFFIIIIIIITQLVSTHGLQFHATTSTNVFVCTSLCH